MKDKNLLVQYIRQYVRQYVALFICQDFFSEMQFFEVVDVKFNFKFKFT